MAIKADPAHKILASPSLFVAFFAVLFLVIFSYTITLMGSIYIVSDLGGSNLITTYTISFFAIGNALGVPLGRSLLGYIGAVRLLVLCLLLFAFFSLCSAFSSYFFLFLAMRFLQGVVSGPFYTIINRLFAYFTPLDKKELFTSLMLTLFTICPALGACWGGWISYDYNWRLIFFINIPLILTLACFISYKLKNFELIETKRKFDAVGYFFYSVGFFCICFVLTVGQEFDWFRSPFLVTLLCIGIPCFIFFVIWSLHHPDPIINFRLLRSVGATFGLVQLAILFSIYFGTVVLLALWLSLYVNYTPIWIAVLLGTMALSGMLPTFLLISRLQLIDTRWMLIVAIILLAISSFHTSLFNVDIDFERIAFSRITAGFGLAFFLPPIFRLCFHSLKEKRGVQMVVLFQLVRAVASGLGAPLYSILWQRRQVFYHERLGSKLTAFSEQTSQFFMEAKKLAITGEAANAQLEYFLQREATSLALNDCFYLMGWILVGAALTVVVSLFFKKSYFIPEKVEQ